MCGIFGNYCFRLGNDDPSVFASMALAVGHRGPDASGFERDDRAAVGNARLSIIDLTEQSNQPLFSDDRQIVVVQNGEIYNYLELRDELGRLGHRFHTEGDTEVILRAYEAWGSGFVTRLNGMFAIAVYDRADDKVLLYRDRLGVKPLYYFDDQAAGQLWFGSEIKALLAAGVRPQASMEALAAYFALNFVPEPLTAFEGILHVRPGHMVELAPDGVRHERYWDLADVEPEPDMRPAEAKAELVALLDDATRIRMRADADFGAFLSGGLDSSSVVGLMSTYQSEPVKTFSIGFDDPRFDETAFARAASRRFGTLHQSQVMNLEATAEWPRFIWHVDQPHGDVSFMPMDQVSALAAREVKMVLTGDGGDELFAGYDKYAAFFYEGRTGDPELDWVNDYARSSGLLQGNEPEELLTGALAEAFKTTDPYGALTSQMRRVPHHDKVNQVLFADTSVLLPGNNLVKPDRMAMANSLEVRSPFLDYRMAEFAFRVPGAMKLIGSNTKAIYKDAVEPFLGAELTHRKKQMFTVPVGEWFRSGLADYCRSVLLDGRLGSRDIVSESAVAAMVDAHLAGRSNFTRQLRALISLELWYRIFIDRDPEWLAAAQAESKETL